MLVYYTRNFNCPGKRHSSRVTKWEQITSWCTDVANTMHKMSHHPPCREVASPKTRMKVSSYHAYNSLRYLMFKAVIARLRNVHQSHGYHVENKILDPRSDVQNQNCQEWFQVSGDHSTFFFFKTRPCHVAQADVQLCSFLPYTYRHMPCHYVCN